MCVSLISYVPYLGPKYRTSWRGQEIPYSVTRFLFRAQIKREIFVTLVFHTDVRVGLNLSCACSRRAYGRRTYQNWKRANSIYKTADVMIWLHVMP